MSHIYSEGVDKAIAKLENPERIKRHDPAILFSRVDLSVGMKLADLGCGTGFFSLPASSLVKEGGMIYAVDNVPEVLAVLDQKAMSRGITNIKSILGEAAITEIEAGSLDIVLMANVFHDVDRNAVLAEVERILKRSGRLVILDWKRIKTNEGPPLNVRLDFEEVIRWFDSEGWRCLDRFDIGPAHHVLVLNRAV